MPIADRTGQEFGSYKLIKLIGEGGFGQVYLGEHMYLGTTVAVKVSLNDNVPQDELTAFIKEAQIVKRLHHTNIIEIIDFGIEKRTNTPFLVMEYLPNGSLANKHPLGVRLSPKEVGELISQIAEAIQFLHDQNVVHQDIKPENILFKGNQVVLTDLGNAVILTTTTETLKQIIASPYYISPEQIKKNLKRQSDQYALAIVAYELLGGTRLFDGQTKEILQKHLTQKPSKIPHLHQAIMDVLQKALEKDPNDRFNSVADFAHALQEAIRESLLPPKPKPQQLVLPKPKIVPPAPVQAAQKPIQQQLKPKVQSTGTRWAWIKIPITFILITIIFSSSVLGITSLISTKNHQQVSIKQPTKYAGKTVTPIKPGTNTTTKTIASFVSQGYVNAMLWSPDGSKIATIGEQFLSIWNATTGQRVSETDITTSSYNEPVQEIWAPDGNTILVLYRYNEAVIISGSDGTIITSFNTSLDENDICTWSADGSKIAVEGFTSDSNYKNHYAIKIVDNTTDNIIDTIPENIQASTALAWSPDGNFLISAYPNKTNTVQIWDTRINKKTLEYNEHNDVVEKVVWSKNKNTITSLDKTEIKIWSPENGKTIKTYTTKDTMIDWSPDGNYALITKGINSKTPNLITIWDMNTNKQLVLYAQHKGTILLAIWSPIGELIASYDNMDTINIWKLT